MFGVQTHPIHLTSELRELNCLKNYFPESVLVWPPDRSRSCSDSLPGHLNRLFGLYFAGSTVSTAS